MNQSKSLFAGIFMFAALAYVPEAFGQMTIEPSHEITFQLIIGSNESGPKANVPPNLSAVSQRLKSNFAYSNYRLAETLFARLSNKGKFSYKSGTNFGREVGSQPQGFLEITVGELKSGQTAKGGQGFQIESLWFGARVPVWSGAGRDDASKERTAFSYEQIGLTVGKFGLQENVPTLIGTLSQPGSHDTIFLVMTLKSVDL